MYSVTMYRSVVIASTRRRLACNEGAWIIEARRPAALSRRHWCGGCRLLARIPVRRHRRGTRDASLARRRIDSSMREETARWPLTRAPSRDFSRHFYPARRVSLSLSLTLPLPSAARHLAGSFASSTVCRPAIVPCAVVVRPDRSRGRSVSKNARAAPPPVRHICRLCRPGIIICTVALAFLVPHCVDKITQCASTVRCVMCDARVNIRHIGFSNVLLVYV